MVAPLIYNDNDSNSNVMLIEKNGEKHIVDLNQLAEADLNKLKKAAYQELFNIDALRAQAHEVLRRINGVLLDARVNNAACLGLNSDEC